MSVARFRALALIVLDENLGDYANAKPALIQRMQEDPEILELIADHFIGDAAMQALLQAAKAKRSDVAQHQPPRDGRAMMLSQPEVRNSILFDDSLSDAHLVSLAKSLLPKGTPIPPAKPACAPVVGRKLPPRRVG